MANPILGEIRMFAGNFAPYGWAFCNGQIMSIAQNTALFSLLGTIYGGDGRTTFALPDLRGRVPLQWGNGSGLSPYTIGQRGGAESVALSVNQMPTHNHLINADPNGGTQSGPGGGIPAVESTGTSSNYSATPSTTMASGMVSNAGGDQAHANIQPFLCVSFIIALQGIYPTRS